MSKSVFEPKALQALYEMKLINDEEHRRLSDLSLEELREMNGVLPEDYAGSLTPFINRRLDLMRHDSREAAIAAYLEGMVKFWREQKKKALVPASFEASYLALPEKERFAFIATFYVDAFQTIHDSLFDELVPEDA